MIVRPLRLLGDPLLRTPSAPVTRFDASLASLIADLIELARCLQHETDHLHGELYIDKLAGAERRRIMRELRLRQITAGA